MSVSPEVIKWREFFRENLPEGTEVKLFFQRMEFTLMLPNMVDLFDLDHPEVEMGRERRTMEFKNSLWQEMQAAGASSFDAPGGIKKILYIKYKPDSPVSIALQEIAILQRVPSGWLRE